MSCENSGEQAKVPFSFWEKDLGIGAFAKISQSVNKKV
jgi:hypothetical protein